MFITFEGPEGSGKSTQIVRVSERLRESGFTVVTTREPGGTLLGERLRNLLLDGDLVPCAVTEAYLMTAARAEHVRKVIRPALERGEWVLCDRFADSTLAYQGAGRKIDVGDLRSLQSLATGGLVPDLTILLDVDVETGLGRRNAHGGQNRIDQEEVSFHKRVADWYRTEAQSCPARWVIVDASKSIELVEQQIVSALPVHPSPKVSVVE